MSLFLASAVQDYIHNGSFTRIYVALEALRRADDAPKRGYFVIDSRWGKLVAGENQVSIYAILTVGTTSPQLDLSHPRRSRRRQRHSVF